MNYAMPKFLHLLCKYCPIITFKTSINDLLGHVSKYFLLRITRLWKMTGGILNNSQNKQVLLRQHSGDVQCSIYQWHTYNKCWQTITIHYNCQMNISNSYLCCIWISNLVICEDLRIWLGEQCQWRARGHFKTWPMINFICIAVRWSHPHIHLDVVITSEEIYLYMWRYIWYIEKVLCIMLPLCTPYWRYRRAAQPQYSHQCFVRKLRLICWQALYAWIAKTSVNWRLMLWDVIKVLFDRTLEIIFAVCWWKYDVKLKRLIGHQKSSSIGFWGIMHCSSCKTLSWVISPDMKFTTPY